MNPTVVAAAGMVALAFYGLMTVSHIVKLVAYFLLSSSGLILLVASLGGAKTELAYLLIVVSATEEIIGLALAILHYRRHGTALLRRPGGEG